MTLGTITNKMGELLSTSLGGLWVEDDAPAFVERRAYARARVRFNGTIDADGQRISVRGIDLHRAGARIAVEEPLPVGAVVFFFARSLGLMGWATVRWGSWCGQKYHLGLEFRQPLMRAEVGIWSFSCVLSEPATGSTARA